MYYDFQNSDGVKSVGTSKNVAREVEFHVVIDRHGSEQVFDIATNSVDANRVYQNLKFDIASGVKDKTMHGCDIKIFQVKRSGYYSGNINTPAIVWTNSQIQMIKGVSIRRKNGSVVRTEIKKSP